MLDCISLVDHISCVPLRSGGEGNTGIECCNCISFLRTSLHGHQHLLCTCNATVLFRKSLIGQARLSEPSMHSFQKESIGVLVSGISSISPVSISAASCVPSPNVPSLASTATCNNTLCSDEFSESSWSFPRDTQTTSRLVGQ